MSACEVDYSGHCWRQKDQISYYMKALQKWEEEDRIIRQLERKEHEEWERLSEDERFARMMGPDPISHEYRRINTIKKQSLDRLKELVYDLKYATNAVEVWKQEKQRQQRQQRQQQNSTSVLYGDDFDIDKCFGF